MVAQLLKFKKGKQKSSFGIRAIIGGVKMERWKKWIPIDDLPQTIYNEHILDNSEGITLLFSDVIGNKNIEVFFDGGVLSYRNTDEGSLFKTLSFLEETYGTDFYSESF